ncbi:Uncharacterised protein, partial [Mycoplasma putrefaciens]
MLEKGGLTTTEAKNVLESLSGNGGSKEFTKSAIANLIKLFDKINQRNMPEKDENKMFTTLNKDEGIIAYIDGDGLHITKIDGYALTNNNSDSSNTNEEINTIEQTKIIKTIESLYSSSEGKELVPYLVNSMINTSNNNDTTDTSGW